MLHLVLGLLALVLAGALGVLLRRAARLRAEAASAEVRLARLRARIEHASAHLARSSRPTPASELTPDTSGERRPRERRRSRRSQSPSAQP